MLTFEKSLGGYALILRSQVNESMKTAQTGLVTSFSGWLYTFSDLLKACIHHRGQLMDWLRTVEYVRSTRCYCRGPRQV